MAILIHDCKPIAFGCKVTFAPDADSAFSYLKEKCTGLGWEVGESKPHPGDSRLIVFVRGPSKEEFQTALESEPEFDFSRCR